MQFTPRSSLGICGWGPLSSGTAIAGSAGGVTGVGGFTLVGELLATADLVEGFGIACGSSWGSWDLPGIKITSGSLQATFRGDSGGFAITSGVTVDFSKPFSFALNWKPSSGIRFVIGGPQGSGQILTASLSDLNPYQTVSTVGCGGSMGLSTSLFAIVAGSISDGALVALAQDPWGNLLARRPRHPKTFFLPAVVTVFYPNSDITVTGWTASSGSSLAAMVGETTLDRGTYITSPDLSTSATMSWGDGAGHAASVPVGTWDVDVDGAYLTTSGQVRIVLLDSGGTAVGTSSWQTLTSSDTTYTLSVTTTGVSTKFRYEIQS
jgi:hypothetical protein